eukprot:m.44461 g.44461  ORF g.44461 m.44461 type:complete len:397 (+) comp10096_c0_seq3:23-1213(+)
MANPFLSPLQRKAAAAQYPPVPKNCVVTGGSGFVGQRLVEMLVERGAEQVISFDIVEKPKNPWEHKAIKYIAGDIANMDDVMRVCEGADCVFHLAAAVGPFHPTELYDKVNRGGTVNVIKACRAHKVPKIVMSSSPSTRFDGSDIDGLTEDEMPKLPLPQYMQEYAETKALGELEMSAACCDELLTVSVAPHQVYGPRDNLFMPNVLEAAGTGKLRIFSKPETGYGMNRVCFTHVDNYCHGLILAEKALYKGSPALGKFYIVTDGDTHSHADGYGYFWKEMDKAIVGIGFASLWEKAKLPYWFLMVIAYMCNVVGYVAGLKLKLNPFNVKVLTMHRWFKITAAERDLHFSPIIRFDEGWEDNTKWFQTHWLPSFHENKRTFGLAKQSDDKIEAQRT